MRTLGRVAAYKGRIAIIGPKGTLWEYPVSGPLDRRDEYELEGAAQSYGHPLSTLRRAARAAAR